jgi:release factor glutamine methyltransferase
LEKANFFGLDFFVDKRVLIPRNDTEIMVKEVLNEAKMHKNITLFDI